jgi:3-isopropylmalate/(R)-2-methylmalate dehydratase small subunit
LDRADVDTDQIIPARHLRRIQRTGFGKYAFELWRRDPGFVLNDERYQGAKILIAGPNFGCGSSREHAAWALQDFGFEVIVAPSFADIFRNNCASIGILTVRLEEKKCKNLMERAENSPGEEIVVDLEQQTITGKNGDLITEFDVDPFVKHCLASGLDAIDLTLADIEAIERHEAKRPSFLPSTKKAKGASK